MAVKFGGVRGDGLTYAASPAVSALTICGFAAWPAPSAGRAAITNLFNGSSDQVVVHQNGSSQLETDGFNGGTLQLGSITANTWYFFAVVLTGTTAVLYIGPATGGVVTSTSGSLAASGFTPTSIQLFINQLYTGSDFNASGAGIRIWSAALNSTEVGAERAQFAPVRSSNLYASWRLLDSATCTADNSGNSRTLTKVGTATTVADPAGVPEGGGASTPAITPSVWSQPIARPFLLASRQMATALAPSPLPNATAPLGVGGDFPSRTIRAALAVSAMQSFALAPRPERTSPLASVVFPDSVGRPAIRPGAHQSFAIAPLQRAFDPATFPVSEWPDSVARPPSPVANRWSFAGGTVPIPDVVTVTFFAPSFPDAVARPALRVEQQLSFAIGPTPILPVLLDVHFPDAIPRPSPWSSQQSGATPPLPATPPFPDTEYPHAFQAARRPTSLLAVPPQPERTSPLTDAVFPSAVGRASFVPAAVQAFAIPQLLAPLVTPVFPDSAARAGRAPWQSTPFAIAPLPIVPLPIAPGFPDAVGRPTIRSPQAFAFSPSPLPNTAAPTLAAVTFPDAAPRPLPRPTAQSFAFAPLPIPNAPAPTFAAGYYPDAARRSALPTASHPSFTAAPSQIVPLVLPTFPHALRRAAQAAPQSFALAPLPQAPLPLVTFPDALTRARSAAGTIHVVPLAVLPPLVAPTFPDAARRASMATSAHLATALGRLPAPVILPPYFGATFPDATTLRTAPHGTTCAFVSLSTTSPATFAGTPYAVTVTISNSASASVDISTHASCDVSIGISYAPAPIQIAIPFTPREVS